MILTPENITEQFIRFVKGKDRLDPDSFSAFNHTFWQVEMDALFGNEEMARATGDTRFEGVPHIRDLMQDACKTRGVTGMKAEFLYNLHHHTDATGIGGGGMKVILEQIIDFQPRENST